MVKMFRGIHQFDHVSCSGWFQACFVVLDRIMQNLQGMLRSMKVVIMERNYFHETFSVSYLELTYHHKNIFLRLSSRSFRNLLLNIVTMEAYIHGWKLESKNTYVLQDGIMYWKSSDRNWKFSSLSMAILTVSLSLCKRNTPKSSVKLAGPGDGRSPQSLQGVTELLIHLSSSFFFWLSHLATCQLVSFILSLHHRWHVLGTGISFPEIPCHFLDFTSCFPEFHRFEMRFLWPAS